MPLNRYLIAAGTEHYTDAFERLEEVPAELKTVVSIFKRFGYVEKLTDLRRDPESRPFQVAVERFLRAPERTKDDVIVIYYTGHGFSEDSHHFLAAADTEPDSIATAIESAFFVRLRRRGSPLRHVLVILDACASAAGAVNAAQIGAELRERGAAEGAGVWTLAAAGSREEAFQGAFANALGSALDDAVRASGTVPDHVALETLIQHLNAHLNQQYDGDQRAFCSPPGGLVVGTPPFFANPSYEPAGGDGLDLETRRRWGPDLRAHFDPKSRGVDRAGDPGSYFTGRTNALETLRRWLESGDDIRPRVVSGQPGAGKSAVLGQLLARSGSVGTAAEEPSRWPRIDAALLARNKDVPALTRELSEALGARPASNPAELKSVLARIPRVIRIVVDALDEADEPLAVASDLLLPLIRDTDARVLLLLGSREMTRRRLPFDHVPIDLDAPEYLHAEDLVDYVASVLLAADNPGSSSPYRGREPEARAVAQEVGRRAAGNFLIARVAARTVSRGSHVLEPGELANMAAVWRAVGTAFDRDLARYEADSDRVRDLLTPLAWAQGFGLPWETLWAPIATAISGLAYSDEDIAWVQEHAGAYVVEAEEDGRAVFRLIHQELTDHLRGDGRAVQIEAALLDACLQQIPRRGDGALDWPLTHPYLRRHLAAHAAAAERIDELLMDPGFLVTADPARLSRAARRAKGYQGTEAAAVHLLAAEDLDRIAVPERAARLALVAHERAQDWLVNGLAPLLAGAPWSPEWTDWAGADPSRIITRLPKPIRGLTAFNDGERWLIAVGDTAGRIRVLNAVTDERSLEAQLDEPVWTIRPALLDGVWFVLAGDFDGRLHAWRATDWAHTVLAAHGSSLGAIASGLVDGAPIVFTAGRAGDVDLASGLGRSEGPGVIRSWDPRSWTALTPGREAFWGGISQLDLVSVDGTPVLLATGDAWKDEEAAGSAVRAFEPRSLKPLFDLPTGRPPITRSTTTPDNALLLLEFVEVYQDRVSRWDLRNRTMVATAPVPGGSSQSIAFTDLHGLPVAAVTLDDGIQLFNATALTPLEGWRRIATRNQAVLCFAQPAGHSILVSGGDDGALREWDLGWATTTAPNRIEPSRVYSLAIADDGQDRRVIASRAGGGEIRRLRDGAGLVPEPRLNGVIAMAAAGSLVVAGDRDGKVSTFRFPDWEHPLGTDAHEGGVRHVALHDDGTRVLCATAGADHRVRLRDGTTLRPMSPPLMHTGYEDKTLGMVTFASLNGDLTLFAGGAYGHLVTWAVDKLPPEDALEWTFGTVESSISSPHPDSVLTLAVARTSNVDVLFSGGWDGQVLGLRLDTGEWWEPGHRHGGPVRAICVAAHGNQPRLVTGGDDELLGLWYVGQDGFELLTFIPLGSPVSALAASGDTVVAGTAAGVATLRLTA